MAAAVAPKQIGLASAVEVVLSDDRPAGGYASNPGRRDLRAVRQPHPRVAAGVAPGDVALAVAIEVVGIGGPPARPDEQERPAIDHAGHTDEGRASIRRQRNAGAEEGLRKVCFTVVGQLLQLGPSAVAAGEKPRRAGLIVEADAIAKAAHDG